MEQKCCSLFNLRDGMEKKGDGRKETEIKDINSLGYIPNVKL